MTKNKTSKWDIIGKSRKIREQTVNRTGHWVIFKPRDYYAITSEREISVPALDPIQMDQ